MEKNEGFKVSPAMLIDAGHALILGDLFLRCLYKVRPYELVKGSAEALHRQWAEACVAYLRGEKGAMGFAALCRGIVRDFDELPIDESLKKPRVGIVGEILVKYMPLANNHLVELLENEGAEAVVPDLMDFMNYCFYNGTYKYKYLGAKKWIDAVSRLGVSAVLKIRKPALEALKASKRFSPPQPIGELAEQAAPILSVGNQSGEGWFLTGEMTELLKSGVKNIICIQPFGCLANHVAGKGVIKQLKKLYPGANIVAVDYDPGASSVNQLNRVKLMLSAARRSLEQDAALPAST